jgi:hypothetical protein
MAPRTRGMKRKQTIALLVGVMEPLFDFLSLEDKANLSMTCRDARHQTARLRPSTGLQFVLEQRMPIRVGTMDTGLEEMDMLEVWQIQTFRFLLTDHSSAATKLQLDVTLWNLAWLEVMNYRISLDDSGVHARTNVEVIIWQKDKERKARQVFARRPNWHGQPISGESVSPRLESYWNSGFQINGIAFSGKAECMEEAKVLEESQEAVRNFMSCIFECCKRISSAFPDVAFSCPSVEYMMRNLPEKLHPYFPAEFDWNAPCHDGDTTPAFAYESAISRLDFLRRIPDLPHEMEEHTITSDGNIGWPPRPLQFQIGYIGMSPATIGFQGIQSCASSPRVNVFQIRTFRCHLCTDCYPMVAQLKLYEWLWCEEKNQRVANSPKETRTLIDFEIRSFCTIFDTTKLFHLCWDQDYYFDGFGSYEVDEGPTDARLHEFEDDIRSYMSVFFECSEAIASCPYHGVSTPSKEYIISTLPNVFHQFLPPGFRRAIRRHHALCEAPQAIPEFTYRPAKTLQEWEETISPEFPWQIIEYSVEELPRYRMDDSHNGTRS